MKRKLWMVGCLILIFFLGGCGTSKTDGVQDGITFHETEEKTNYVKVEMTSGKIMLLELYPDIAPITVENFQKLVQEKFYDNLIFHRVIEGFMIQGGDPNGTGTGGSKDKIKGEFKRNGVENNLSHERGVLSMARSNNYDSASSQFFICHADASYLDGEYAAFGRLIAGFTTLDEIATTKVKNETPTTPQKIKSIRFVTIERSDDIT